jgi:glycosyltransferase involved in cell wall biosynthesis
MKSPTRVLIVTYTGGTGGVGVQIRNVLEVLRADARFHFEVCITQAWGVIADEIKAMGIAVHFLGMKNGYDVIRGVGLLPLIRHGEFDVVAFHGIIPLVRLLIALGSPARSIISENGAIQADFMRRRAYMKYIHRFLDAWTDAYIVDCNRSVEDLRVEHKVDRKKIHVIYNGIDIAHFHPGSTMNLKKDLGIEESAHIVGTVRGMIEKMGYDHLIEAARYVCDVRQDVHFVIVGDGPLRNVLENGVRRVGLVDRVHFLGTRRDIPEILPNFELFLLPSLWEGLPVSAVESLAAGTPIVAYDVGGIRDAVIDGITGVLLPTRDSRSLAAAIMELIDDPRRRSGMSVNARKRAEECFDIRMIAAQFAALYADPPGMGAPA